MATESIPPTPDAGETTERREILKGLLAALVAGAVMFIAVIGFITLLNTSSLLGEVHTGQQTNARNLAATRANTAQLKRDEHVVVGIGRYLVDTNQVICTSLHLTCPSAP